MSSATERLRELLDERDVEYRVSATGYSIDIGPYTTAYANRSDTTLDVSLRQVTPEQAIGATLGRGTCKWKPADFITEGDWWNTECGESFTWEPYGVPKYCPNCGRRVEVDE